MTEVEVLEAALGLEFRDKSLLHRAMVHRSYLNEHPDFPLEDNERLEFLGDAVLDFLTAEYLYHRYPEMAEGHLTSLRAALVRREALAHFATELGLGGCLLMGVGEAASGGRERPVILCAAFEALIGALYLDQGLAPVRVLVEARFGPEIERVVREESDKDAKTRLQEFVQGRMQQTPRYSTTRETGPDHAKTFTVEVAVGGVVYGAGTGRNKQQAAQMAAEEALGRLEGDGQVES